MVQDIIFKLPSYTAYKSFDCGMFFYKPLYRISDEKQCLISEGLCDILTTHLQSPCRPLFSQNQYRQQVVTTTESEATNINLGTSFAKKSTKGITIHNLFQIYKETTVFKCFLSYNFYISTHLISKSINKTGNKNSNVIYTNPLGERQLVA